MEDKETFTCPICGYAGAFAERVDKETGIRKHALCPRCGSRERHRLQYLVVEQLGEAHDFSTMSLLHIAPESYFEAYFRGRFKQYESADLRKPSVNVRVDLRHLPFEDGAYDLVFASHVLEHIRDDTQAVSEISRVLRRGGIAVLPVPILGDETVEYPEPNPHESGHVRAPGKDYYDKYAPYFERIVLFDSTGFPAEHQLFVYEDRSNWPASMPGRLTSAGESHVDIVPVCFR